MADESAIRYLIVSEQSAPRYFVSDQSTARYVVQELCDYKLVLVQTLSTLPTSAHWFFSSTGAGFTWSSTHRLMSGGYTD